MIGEIDVAFSILAITLASLGLAAVNRAHPSAILKARTIGRAREEAGLRSRDSRRASAKSRALKRPMTMADVPSNYADACGGAGSPEHGPLAYYCMRFLPEETESLSDEYEKLQPAAVPPGEALAVFAALDDESRDAGARRLSRRLRAEEVARGDLDSFPLACCFSARATGSDGASPSASKNVPFFVAAMASDDPPFVSAEPSGSALASWNLGRLRDAAVEGGVSFEDARGSGLRPKKVLVLRLSGRGANGFAPKFGGDGPEGREDREDREDREARLQRDGAFLWTPVGLFAIE